MSQRSDRISAAFRAHPRVVAACVLGVLLGLVCLRSWPFLYFAHAHLDSDQAVYGLMAKDISLGRAYPLFMYGQRNILAIGAWLCAPLVALFGPSVTVLKLPMFAMNLGCVVMLWLGLRRERDVGLWGAALATVPFAAVSTVVASRLVEHGGGNVEPIFFMLLMFLLRERPIAYGVVLGFAFLNREFAPIGLIALLLLDALAGTLRQRLRFYAIALLIAGAVVLVVRALAEGTVGYEGTSVTPHLQNPLSGEGLAGFFQQQLPVLLGLRRIELGGFVVSDLHVGHDWLRYVAALWAVLGVVSALRLRRAELHGMSSYLLLIGLGQTLAFILLCEAPHDPVLVRYVLVSVCAWPGLAAIAWKTPAFRPWIALAVLVLSASNMRDSVRVGREYVRHEPQADNAVLASALAARGIHYAQANFWQAYEITWLTDERIIVQPPPNAADRIKRYHEALQKHRDEVVVISEQPCKHGEQVLRWYLCRPRSKRL